LQDVSNAGRKGHVSLVARIAVATAALVWVLRGLDWQTLKQLSPWYFGLSVLTYAAGQAVNAVRWWLLLRAQRIRIEVWTAVRLFFLGLFYNNVMPGSVGGDLLKAWYVTKHTHRRLEGALSVFVDRAIGLAGMAVMAVFTYLVFVWGRMPVAEGAEQAEAPGWFSQHRSVVLWVAVALAAGFAAILAHPAGRTRLAHAAARLRAKGVAVLARVKDAIVLYCSRPGTLLAALGLTFLSQSTVIVAFWLLGRNLGIEARLRYYFVIFPIAWVVGAVPISVAGLGIVEAGTVGLFTRLTGTPRALATVLALCQRFVWVLASLPGGLVHALGAHLPAEEISIDGHQQGN
jgi:glycosyltransferase 2 family protein